jgi:hypothetical protein
MNGKTAVDNAIVSRIRIQARKNKQAKKHAHNKEAERGKGQEKGTAVILSQTRAKEKEEKQTTTPGRVKEHGTCAFVALRFLFHTITFLPFLFPLGGLYFLAFFFSP